MCIPASAVRAVLVSQFRMLSSLDVEVVLRQMLGVEFIFSFSIRCLDLICDAHSEANLEQLVA